VSARASLCARARFVRARLPVRIPSLTEIRRVAPLFRKTSSQTERNVANGSAR
jgi:hypothetical protein